MGIMIYDLMSLEMPQLSGYARKSDGCIVDFSTNNMELKDAGAASKQGLNITLEATASGAIINERVYTGKSVKSKASTFVDKPILKHHNQYDDALGRVVGARFVQYKDDLDAADLDPAIQINGKVKGEPSGIVEVDAFIPDLLAMQKIADERLKYVSQGGLMKSAKCSVCGSNWAEGDFCEHEMGQHYTVKTEDGKKRKQRAYLMIDIDEYIELSFVNTPAWRNAKVINIENTELSDEMKKINANIETALADMRADIIPSRVKKLTLCDSFGRELALIEDGRTPEPHNIVDKPTEKSEMAESIQDNQEFKKLQDEVSKLSDQRDTMLNQLADKDQRIKEYESSIKDLETQLEESNAQMQKLFKAKKLSDAQKLLQMRKVLGKIEDAKDEALLESFMDADPEYLRGCIDSITDEYEAAVEKATRVEDSEKSEDTSKTDEKLNVKDEDVGTGQRENSGIDNTATSQKFTPPTALE